MMIFELYPGIQLRLSRNGRKNIIRIYYPDGRIKSESTVNLEESSLDIPWKYMSNQCKVYRFLNNHKNKSYTPKYISNVLKMDIKEVRYALNNLSKKYPIINIPISYTLYQFE